MALEALRPPHVLQFLQKAGGRTQANRDVALLSTSYKLANALGWLKTAGYNPCHQVPRNAEKARDRYVPDEGMAAVCAELSPKLRAMVVLATRPHCGIRRKKGSDLPLEDAVKLLGHSGPRVTVRHYRAGPRVV